MIGRSLLDKTPHTTEGYPDRVRPGGAQPQKKTINNRVVPEIDPGSPARHLDDRQTNPL
jgi:hypothetical protein